MRKEQAIRKLMKEYCKTYGYRYLEQVPAKDPGKKAYPALVCGDPIKAAVELVCYVAENYAYLYDEDLELEDLLPTDMAAFFGTPATDEIAASKILYFPEFGG